MTQPTWELSDSFSGGNIRDALHYKSQVISLPADVMTTVRVEVAITSMAEPGSLPVFADPPDAQARLPALVISTWAYQLSSPDRAPCSLSTPARRIGKDSRLAGPRSRSPFGRATRRPPSPYSCSNTPFRSVRRVASKDISSPDFGRRAGRPFPGIALRPQTGVIGRLAHRLFASPNAA